MKCQILSNHAEGRHFGSGRLTSDQTLPVLVSGFSSHRSAAVLHLPGYRYWYAMFNDQSMGDKAVWVYDIELGGVLLQTGSR
jgi:hypothetical protein